MTAIPRLQYPPATRKLDGGAARDGLGFGPYALGEQSVGVVIHTTETVGLPGYLRQLDNGQLISVAPHFTYLPATRSWVQHVETDRRCGTLVGTSTTEDGKRVPTNAARVLQVELACYSSKATADQYGRLWVGALDDEHLADIADFLRWCHESFGTPLVWYRKPKPYGTWPMTHAAWWHDRAAAGWGVCEHATAPDDSTHWDAGAIDGPAIIELARAAGSGGGGGGEVGPVPVKPIKWPALLKPGQRHRCVPMLKGILVGLGVRKRAGRGRRYKGATVEQVQQVQVDGKLAGDGVVGPDTRALLDRLINLGG